MNCILINPPWSTRKGNVWSSIRSTMPPLGLLYLAAVLEQEKIEAGFFDFQANLMDWNEIEEQIKNWQYDVYGISATTAIVKNAYRIVRLIRRHHPKANIVMGGVHPSSMPEEALTNGADVIVRGEGEEIFLAYMREQPITAIQGVSYKIGDKFIHQGPSGIIDDLNLLPSPAYGKIDFSKYEPAVGAFKRLPAISMTATRGCPARCTFCNSANLKIRKRSAENIFKEMEMLATQYGIKEISFYDDTFTVYPTNIKKLCQLLIDNKTDLTWSCFARVDYVTEELLTHMKAAGCHQVMYGIESASEIILENIKKNIEIEHNKRAVKLTKKLGITTRCTFMFGSPGETEETIEQTIKYAIDLNPDIALFNITTPYPGTEMFDWAKNEGYLTTEDWDKYDLSWPVMVLPTISPEAIVAKYHTAFKRFYLRPSVVLMKILSLRSLSDFKILFGGVRNFLTFLFKKPVTKPAAEAPSK
jgi:anaerobic magnesium-protoporphyrin IX monomethyl ester cyclase